MIKKVLSYIKKYGMIEPDDFIVAGISGGADSVCLLFVLIEIRKQIPFTLKAVHVNHGVREDAAQDARYVKSLCEKEKIPFELVEANVKKSARENGLSEEEEGRRVRYQSFRRALPEGKGKIAVAHNSSDRAETMLFHLFRGTGLTGVGGICPVKGNIIRPLLCLSRSEIESWLMEKEISFCSDSTNEQDIYTRNRIRHHILPYAEKEICKKAVEHMNRTADQLLAAEEYIVRQTKEAACRCTKSGAQGEIFVSLPDFFKEDEYLRGRILLACVERAAGSRKNITSAHVASMLKLFEGTGSREVHLPYHITVYKKYDMGMIKREETVPEENLPKAREKETYYVTVPSVLEVSGLGRVEFTVFPKINSQNIPEKTYTKWFDYDKIGSSVALRTRKPGDYLTINCRMGHKSLQDYLVNEKVPRKERDRIYLLADGSHIMWAPGFRISEFYKVREDTRNILQVRVLDKEQSDERSYGNGRKD